jgi:hypothetical protein
LDCKFEEKQYEQPLNFELAVRGSLIFSPGQVFENTLGIDAALFSKNPNFWRMWQKRLRGHQFFSSYRGGTYIDREWWNEFQNGLDDESFPKFKFNVFVQHKRPEFISRTNGSEFTAWKQPYFRYVINSDQQVRLEKLEGGVASEGIVIYTCPAFWRFEELWSYALSHTPIENSNFVQPHNLRGHTRYTFVSGGRYGKAFSDPKDVEGVDLLENIAQMFERVTDFRSNTEFIFSLSKRISAIVAESDRSFRETYASVISSIADFEQQFAFSFMSIIAFVYLTNISWAIAAKI